MLSSLSGRFLRTSVVGLSNRRGIERERVAGRVQRTAADVPSASAPGQAALKDVTALTIKGVLSYQACDDKLCFTPQALCRWPGTCPSGSWIATAPLPEWSAPNDGPMIDGLDRLRRTVFVYLFCTSIRRFERFWRV